MNKQYWDKYYSKHQCSTNPSNFAKFCLNNYICKMPGSIVDIGCGNFRDTVHFITPFHQVVAIDRVKKILPLSSKHIYIQTDIYDLIHIPLIQFRHYYMRWILHSLGVLEESKLFSWLNMTTRPGSMIYIECRSDKDKKIKDDSHYRRLINSDELKNIVDWAGFNTIFFKEKRGFSKVGNDDPLLIRLIARKKNI